MNIKLNKISVVLLITLLMYCFLAIFITYVRGDESKYHYPTARTISLKAVIQPDSTYNSAYTPLPYFIGGLVLGIHDSIYVLRLLNFLTVIVIVFFAYKIFKRIDRNPELLTLLVISNPYFLRSAFTYHMSAYGIMFALVGVYFYFFSNYRYKNLFAFLFQCLAVLSQQWMLAVTFALLLLELKKNLAENFNIFRLVKKSALLIVLFSPAIYLFYTWRGFTHPGFQSHALHPSFEHLTALLAHVGFAFGLIVLMNIRSLLKIKYVPLVFVFPLIYLSVPVHSQGHGVREITGITSQFSMQIERFLHIPYSVSMLAFSILGLAAMVLLLRKDNSDSNFFLKGALSGFFAAFIASTRLSSAHIYTSFPFLTMAFSREINHCKNWSMLIALQFFLVAVFYITYYVFFVSHGIQM